MVIDDEIIEMYRRDLGHMWMMNANAKITYLLYDALMSALSLRGCILKSDVFYLIK